MFTEQQNVIEADMAIFGFIDDGLNDTEGMNNSFFDDAGELWSFMTIEKESSKETNYNKYLQRVITTNYLIY